MIEKFRNKVQKELMSMHFQTKRMKAKEKEIFIDILFKNLKKDIISKIPIMPERWEEQEILWYLTEKLRDRLITPLRGKKKREYNNDIAISGNL